MDQQRFLQQLQIVLNREYSILHYDDLANKALLTAYLSRPG